MKKYPSKKSRKNCFEEQEKFWLTQGDSCVNQLLAITHEIYKLFDEGFEVREVFLDISKAFVKV